MPATPHAANSVNLLAYWKQGLLLQWWLLAIFLSYTKFVVTSIGQAFSLYRANKNFKILTWVCTTIFFNQGGPRILIFGFAAISLTLSVVLSSEARAFCIITDDDGFSNWGQPYIPWLLLPLPKYFGHALLIHALALNTVGDSEL